MAFIHSWHLYQALLDAGLVSEPAEKVLKVSIVLEVGEAVVINIERFADADLKETLPSLLKNAEVVVS